jgi:hypothetical protein
VLIHFIASSIGTHFTGPTFILSSTNCDFVTRSNAFASFIDFSHAFLTSFTDPNEFSRQDRQEKYQGGYAWHLGA